MSYHFKFSPPSFYSSSDNFDTQAQNTFDRFGDSVDSTMKWAVAESVGKQNSIYLNNPFESMHAWDIFIFIFSFS